MKIFRALLFTLVLLNCTCLALAAQSSNWLTPLLPDSFDYRTYSMSIRGNIGYTVGSFSGNLESNSTYSLAGSKDVFVLLENSSNGNRTFVQSGGNGDDEALSMWVDQSNGIFYVTGYFTGTAYFGSDTLISRGAEDVFIARYNAAGTLLYAESYGGPGTDKGLFIQTVGSNIMVCGQYSGSMEYDAIGNSVVSNGGTDGFIFSASATTGAVSWIQTMGGVGSDGANGLCMLSTGDVFVTGYFNGTAQFAPSNITSAGSTDGFLARYTAAGTLSWVVPVGGSGPDTSYAVSVASASNNPCITGSFSDTLVAASDILISRGGNDCFVIYANATTGTLTWGRSSGGPGYDGGRGIAGDNTNIYFAGNSTDTLHFGTTVANPNGGIDSYRGQYSVAGVDGWLRRSVSPDDDELNFVFQSGTNVYSAGWYVDSLQGASPISWTVSLGCNGKASGAPKASGVVSSGYGPYSLAAVGSTFHQIAVDENKSSYAIGVITGEYRYDTVLMVNDPTNNSKACVIKLDSNGTFLWKREIHSGTPTSTNAPYYCEAIPGGGVVATGVFSGTIRFSPTVSVTNPSNLPGIYMVRYDASGNVLWAKCPGYAFSGPAISDMDVDSNGKIYLIGTFTASTLYLENSNGLARGTPTSAGYILRYDSAGTLEWFDGYSTTSTQPITIGMTNIEADPSGNMYFSGSYWGNGAFTDLNLPYGDFSFLAKISPTGALIWSTVICDHESWNATAFNSIKSDAVGNVYFYITFSDSFQFNSVTHLYAPGDTDAGLIKCDAAGNFLWAVQISDPTTPNYPFGELELIDNDEPIILCTEPSNVTYNSMNMGNMPNSTITHIVKFNPLGGVISDSVLGYGQLKAYSFSVQDDFIGMTGYTWYTGATVCGEFIPCWLSVSETPFFAGLPNDTCSPPVANFIYSDNSLGLFTFVTPIPSTQYNWDFGDGNYSTNASPSHQYANTGVYTVCLIATHQCGTDTFCTQVNCLITGMQSTTASAVSVFPNPTENHFNIQCTTVGADYKVYDGYGRTVINGIIGSSGSASVDLSGEANGIYLVSVAAGEQIYLQKIVKE